MRPRTRRVCSPVRPDPPNPPSRKGLFTVEGVGVGGVSCGGVGRGPLMMGVPAPPVQKTSACLALPSAVPM